MTCTTGVRNRPACRANSVAAFSALAVLLLLLSCAAGSALAGPEPPDSYLGIHWQIVPTPSCPHSVTRIQFDACSCNDAFTGVTQLPTGPILMRARVQPSIVCAWCDPDAISFLPGPLLQGSYTVSLEVVADVVDSLGNTHTQTGEFALPFVVAGTCQHF